MKKLAVTIGLGLAPWVIMVATGLLTLDGPPEGEKFGLLLMTLTAFMPSIDYFGERNAAMFYGWAVFYAVVLMMLLFYACSARSQKLAYIFTGLTYGSIIVGVLRVAIQLSSGLVK